MSAEWMNRTGITRLISLVRRRKNDVTTPAPKIEPAVVTAVVANAPPIPAATQPKTFQPKLLREMDEQTIQLVLKATHEIPAFPAIVAELVNDLNSPDVSASRVGNLIKLDPAISAGVLRVANSAAFAGERQVSNVDSAIMILGFDVIQSIAMKSTISGMIQFQRTKAGAYSADALWEHCVATSIYAGCLAKRIQRLESSEASTCGLLHDIGKVLLDACYPEQVEEVLSPASTLLGESLLAKEDRILGACHTAFGARLARHWNLSEPVVLAIELHHHGNSQDVLQNQTTHERDLVAAVFVANQMAKMTGFAGNDNEIDLPSAPLMTRLGFGPDLLEAIAMIPPEIPRKIKAVVGR